ncbi:MAG: fused MFS/spermidine synthase, partial [Burkholderiales bacterium]|nr:fused MFS/spermidine synthase [Burkholderiales bacterium]
HPALLAHPAPKRVLILGGGDGGTAEEVLKHPSVESITIAELDGDVVEASRTHLASIHQGSLDHPKVRIEITDGFAFVERSREHYDLIVLDLTDPDTPAFRLYSPEFLGMCRSRLAPGGFLTMHVGSPVYQPETVRRNVAALREVFREVHPLAAFMPLYGSLWCLAIASNDATPRLEIATLERRAAERRIGELQYYYPALTPALFTLPRYVERLVAAPYAAAPLTAIASQRVAA